MINLPEYPNPLVKKGGGRFDILTIIVFVLALWPMAGLEAQTRESAAVELDVRNRTHSDWSPLGIRMGGGGTAIPFSRGRYYL